MHWICVFLALTHRYEGCWSFWCGKWNILFKLIWYHVCWYPGSLWLQVINSPGIDCEIGRPMSSPMREDFIHLQAVQHAGKSQGNSTPGRSQGKMWELWYRTGKIIPDSKVHGANMGPIWGRQDPGGPHVCPMDFAIWDISEKWRQSRRIILLGNSN